MLHIGCVHADAVAIVDSAPFLPETRVEFDTNMAKAILANLCVAERVSPLYEHPVALSHITWSLSHVAEYGGSKSIQTGENLKCSLVSSLYCKSQMILAGGGDRLVPVDHVQRYVDSQKVNGNSVEISWWHNSAHMQHMYDDPGGYRSRSGVAILAHHASSIGCQQRRQEVP